VHDGGYPIAQESDGIPNWKDAPPIVPSVKDQVRAEG
jgi:enoyl-CoA hydratase